MKAVIAIWSLKTSAEYAAVNFGQPWLLNTANTLLSIDDATAALK